MLLRFFLTLAFVLAIVVPSRVTASQPNLIDCLLLTLQQHDQFAALHSYLVGNRVSCALGIRKRRIKKSAPGSER